MKIFYIFFQVMMICMFPIVSNLSYLYFVNNSSLSTDNLEDNYTYLIDLRYTYPDIPNDSYVDFNFFKGFGDDFDKTYKGSEVMYKDVDVNLISYEKRQNFSGEYYFNINLSRNTCDLLTRTEEIEVHRKIIGPGSLFPKFPGYAYNIYQIKYGHTFEGSDSEIVKFIKNKCKINSDFEYTLHYDDYSYFYENP